MRIVLLLALVACTGTSSAVQPTPPQKPAPAAKPDPAKVRFSDGPCGGKTLYQCMQAADAYSVGITGVPKDVKRAAAMFRAGCEVPFYVACVSLADLGKQAGLDDAAARTLYQSACDHEAQWCISYAIYLEDTEVAADVAHARRLFGEACDRGDGSSCMHLSDHASGLEAIDWAKKACASREVGKCDRLVRVYGEDEDPRVTPAQATRALEELCDNGDPLACSGAGLRHMMGRGAVASRVEADRWSAKACDLGDVRVCSQVGTRLLLDNDLRGVAFLEKACAGGSESDCDTLRRHPWRRASR